MRRILVLGAGYAGIMTALRIHADAAVTVVDGRDRFVQRIRLHELAAGQRVQQPALADMLKRPNIDFVQGWVKAIRPDQRQVVVATSQAERTLDYDVLVYALGSHGNHHRVAGVADYAYTLDPAGERSAAALRGVLPALNARGGRLAVVGGGLTGIEAASEFVEAYPGLHIQLVSSGEVGDTLSAKARQFLRQRFARLGVELVEQTAIARVAADALVTNDGRRLPVDVVLWTASFSVPPLSREAGLAVDAAGRLLVDTDLRSLSHPDVFGIGDAAAVVERDGVPIRMACATAMPIGAHAAKNINALLAGKTPSPFSFRYALQCLSLGRNAGLVQWVNGYDVPKERIITGRLGALVKEAICRYTLYSLLLERHLPGLFFWPGQRARKPSVRLPETPVQHGSF
jgi:NADH dehydrogenase FAD-containing subunit